jgi:outer membrane receptor protein involved in Fe transport
LIFLKQRHDWKAEIVLFQNDWDDGILIRVDPSLAAGYIYENSGENQSRGVEASLAWLPAPWRVDLSGSYVRSRNLTADQDYDLFPPIMINVGVGRTFGSHGISFYLNNLYSDGAQDVAYNRTLLGAPEDLATYWRTDLNVTKRFASGLDLFVNIINLFDRDNRVPSVLGLPGGVADRPLSVSAGLRGQF